MKVLLIQAPDRREKKVYPIGLCYVAASLKDHHVAIFDPNVIEKPLVQLVKKIETVEPEIVGISIRNLDIFAARALDRIRQQIDIVKKTTVTTAKIIIGGPSFSLYPVDIMEYLSEVNFGISYEGEETILELLENLENPEDVKGVYFRKDGKIHFSGERKRIDFDSFPAPRRDLVDINDYVDRPYSIGVQTKRGCNRKCIYCSYPIVDGTTLRLRSPENIVNEIEGLVKSYDIRSIAFVDNVFNNPIYHAKEICQEMIKRRLDIKWSAWFDDLNGEFLELAIAAGCNEIEFSPDGFSNKTLKLLGKKITKKDILKSCYIFKNMDGIRVHYHFFFWPPGQDLVTLTGLFWFKFKAKFVLKGKLANFRIGPLIIFKNTKLEKLAVEQGIISKDTDLIFSSKIYWNPKWTRKFYGLMRRVFRLPD